MDLPQDLRVKLGSPLHLVCPLCSFTTRSTSQFMLSSLPGQHKRLEIVKPEQTALLIMQSSGSGSHVATAEAEHITAISIFTREANLEISVSAEEVTCIQDACYQQKFKHNMNRKAHLRNFFSTVFHKTLKA